MGERYLLAGIKSYDTPEIVYGLHGALGDSDKTWGPYVHMAVFSD